MTLLEINNVSIEYETEQGNLRAVDDVSLSLNDGEILGVVGESGSGKTTVAKSVNRLLPANGQVIEGEVLFKGEDITTMTEDEIRELRWTEISMIPQSAMSALDPVYKIGKQFREVIRTHTDESKQEARERTEEILGRVGLDVGCLSDYPHELSGGQRQRVVIALALVLKPSIVIADEPTTGLDVVVQDNILDLILEIQEEMDNSMLLITHDISVVAEVADRTAVMYGGRIMEQGSTIDIFRDHVHPYTIGLRNAFPALTDSNDVLPSIPGTPPNLLDPPPGCRFANRCPFATEECEMEPPTQVISNGHESKCHYSDSRSEEFREIGRRAETWENHD